ncbi:protein HGH1 homolog [Ornithodoros turicata]|uniref:protein HGH1 homolog n=1 Tax=Ornithodoros turicata TaxID=34597 RepID=UPI00313954A2
MVMENSAAEKEILQFLSKDTALATKLPAILYVLGLTATGDGLNFLNENRQLLDAVASLLGDPSDVVVSKCCDSLLNATSDSRISSYLLNDHEFITLLLGLLLADNTRHCDKCVAVLNNLTRTKEGAEKIWRIIQDEKAEKLLNMFTQNTSRSEHDRIGFLLSNLTQLPEARGWLMERDACRISKLFPFLTLETSTIRRHSVAAVLRNCCFDTSQHEWLLSAEVDILPRLLFPLMGPEEIDDDEMEKLPLDLQYLGSSKVRESDKEVCQMLIEALIQLCATKDGRAKLRNNGAYYVMRELHKVESNKTVVATCEDLVDILIGDEPEPGMENLREVEVPPHLAEKFDKMKEEMLRE